LNELNKFENTLNQDTENILDFETQRVFIKSDGSISIEKNRKSFSLIKIENYNNYYSYQTDLTYLEYSF